MQWKVVIPITTKKGLFEWTNFNPSARFLKNDSEFIFPVDSFLIDNINVRVQNTEGEQYIILAAIIIAAIGAAIFYLKGYKRS